MHTNDSEVSQKRYKYNGKERDEESGLDYYGARYYASWLCRFISVDPQKDNYPMQNSFAYAANSPVTMVDVNGESPGDPEVEGNKKGDVIVGNDGKEYTLSFDDITIEAEKPLLIRGLEQAQIGVDNNKEIVPPRAKIWELSDADRASLFEVETFNYMTEEASAEEFGNYLNDGGLSFGRKREAFNKRVVSGPARQAGVEFGKFALELSVGYVFEGISLADKAISAANYTSKVNLVKNTSRADDTYEGVRAASEYLKKAGVDRKYRKQILESFDIETITLKTADNSTYGLRFFDNVDAFEKGRYLFPTFTNSTNRVGLALPSKWNKMTGIMQFQIKPGTMFLNGRAASQGGIFQGGSYQMYINNLDNLIK